MTHRHWPFLAGVIGAILFLGGTASAEVCPGVKPSVEQELRSSSMVVVGTATEAHKVPSWTSGYAYTIYVVHVDEAIHGTASKSFWLYSPTTAEYPMTVGVPHILFVHHKPMEDVVDRCGNSAPLGHAGDTYRAAKAAANTPDHATP
ncbi:hypothetical protein KPL74_15295 [Bacillus sp. NP157]|nr:hypothetical protein KPL74_15295 [Bacillus sp. NP157]